MVGDEEIDRLHARIAALERRNAQLEDEMARARHELFVIQMRIERAAAGDAHHDPTPSAAQEDVAQRLYGLAYILDALVRLLPEQPDNVRDELMYLQTQLQETRAMISRAMASDKDTAY